MPALHRVTELGFADFVAMLLVETLDAIVASHSSQEERLRALGAAADQSLDDFAENIDEEVLEATLAELFPDGSGATSVLDHGEVPPAAELAALGVVLTRAAVKDGNLTAAGVAQVRKGVRAHLARTHWESLQEVAHQGVPRVRVDGGVLRSKLTFSALHREEEEPVDPGAPGTRTVARVPGGLATSSRAMLLQRGVLDSIAKTRLTVRPAALAGGGGPVEDPGGEQQASATIYGEVEIRFHTEG